MARKLRIAASLFFAVVAPALCLIWVRSYSIGDGVQLRMNSNSLRIVAGVGIVGAGYLQSEYQGWKVEFPRRPIDDEIKKEIALLTTCGFGYNFRVTRKFIIFPLWLPIALTATAAFCLSPYPIRKLCRFSLRTLLIATTLVAVALGLGVWLAS